MICSESDRATGTCANCRGSKLLFSAARTIGPYETMLRQAVLKGKHSSFEPVAVALGQRLAEAIEQSPFDIHPEIVAPVPMHWLKRLWRGTNPAATIARSVARRLDLPVLEGALVCTRLLERQATLTPQQRRRNVRRAFRASRWAALAGKRILLVDDVMTTGATAHEGSRALIEAGAAVVYVATVARSTPQV
jgi:ComF family protein